MHLPDGEASAAPPPVISPKPAVLSHKMEDKPKPPRPSLPMSEAVNSSVKRPVEPRLPTPDYDSKTPITKSKPLPQTPLTSVQPEKRLGLVTDQRSSGPASEAKKTGKEIKKGHTAPSAAEVPSNLEEKIDALYKDLIPKVVYNLLNSLHYCMIKIMLYILLLSVGCDLLIIISCKFCYVYV